MSGHDRLIAKAKFRIIDVKEGEFRTEFSLEDIIPDKVVYVKPRSLKDILIPEDREEKIGVVFTAIPTATFGLYYKYKVDSLDSKFFKDLVHKLLWMNQGIEFNGLVKMTEYVHRYWVTDKLKINKRAILKHLLKEIPVFLWDENLIVGSKIVFYNKRSMLSREEKISISRDYRRKECHSILRELIHESAIIAIETSELIEDKLKISRRQVFDIAKNDRLKTVKTLNRLIAEKTVIALDEHNKDKDFKRQVTYDKYQRFLKLPKTRSNREISRILSISLTTVSEFKDLRDNG